MLKRLKFIDYCEYIKRQMKNGEIKNVLIDSQKTSKQKKRAMNEEILGD